MKVGIVGTSGYSGGELLRLLAGHSGVEVAYVASTSLVGETLTAHFPSLEGFYDDLRFEPADAEAMGERCDLVFTATPHGVAMGMAEALIRTGAIVIDIGADFRFRRADVFSQWYDTEHTAPELAAEAVYGLPELFKGDIQKARLIANPGCYPTSAILALAPLAAHGFIDLTTVHVCSMSGVSGGGRTPKAMFHLPNAVENVQPYGIPTHRHTPEIEQGIGFAAGIDDVPPISFSPHLVPMSRGILTHVTATAAKHVTGTELQRLYADYYGEAPFVRVVTDRLPDTKTVAGSNFCDLAPVYDERTGRITVVSAIDNLVKGASGQAVQNMNIRLGFNETEGLWLPGMTP